MASRAVRSNILTRDSLPSVKTAFAVVSREESHRSIASMGTSPKHSATAFVAKILDKASILCLSRFEKCVFIGYSNVKKGYELFSLESKNVIFSKDVKFYETVFPFKIKQKEGSIDSGVTTDLNHRNIFDLEQPNPKRPYDEGRVHSNDDGTYSSSLNEDDDESYATSISTP
ncbi:hypothetical protein Tco_0370441 [Tanacetum coccineum]